MSNSAPYRTIITGASSGLGEEMARRYAARGHSLGLCARRLDRLESLQADLRRAHPGITVEVAALDVTDHDAVERVFTDLRTRLGGLDRVVVNAGLGKGARIGTGRAAANIETMTTNVLGALSQIEVATEHFRAQKAGHLVLVSSISADRGLPGTKAAYSASKAAVSALGEALTTELRGTGVTVTTLLPGYIATDMSDKAGDSGRLTATLDTGVSAMVAAIDREAVRAPLPGLLWKGIDVALRFLPNRVTDKLV